MTFYLIGLGLYDERDLTLRALDILKHCDVIYFEEYTSRFSSSLERLQIIIGKTIRPLSRVYLERHLSTLVQEGKTTDIALLVIGTPLSATTHFEFLVEAEKQHISWHVVDNASVTTAIGITGLSLYKLGRVTTIPFDNVNVTSPYEVYQDNKKAGLHTLFLLDLHDARLMTVREGLDYLIRLGLDTKTQAIGCAALGSPAPEIKVGPAEKLTLKKFPQCLLLPGDLNFKEEEALKIWQ